MTTAADAVEARCSARIKIKAGPRLITAAFLRGSATENTLRLQPFIRSSNDTLDPSGHPHLDSFTITGPFNPTGSGDTPSWRQIFSCHPTTPAQEEPCARTILTSLMRRAYRVATEGKLHTPAVLEQQMRRMLIDPKSAALIENFAGQWLYLRNLRTMIPNSLEFPDFDDNLRQSFQRETELFFGSIMLRDSEYLWQQLPPCYRYR